MKTSDELIALAQDYVSGGLDLRTLDMWLSDHIDECDELDRTQDPASGLAGFIQVRIYEHSDGLPEEQIRSDLAVYLSEIPKNRQRAAG